MARNTSEHTPRKPPQIFNQLASFILRSPFHNPISKTLMLLSFTGRKSGKLYTIPVAYTRQGDTIMVFTDHNWWKNLRENAPVTVRIQGEKLTGTAEAISEDKEAIAREMLIFVQQRPGGARAYGVTLNAEGQPDPESVHQAAPHFTLVRIHLNRGNASNR